MKHFLFLNILCSLVLFTNCGEDSEDPVADTPTNNTDDDNTDDGSTDPVNYTLTLTASEGGTVSPESGSFGENEAVELLATPDSTYVFVNWTGSSTSTVNPLSVTMDADKSYTANFVKKQYPLTIIVEGEGAVSEEIVTNGRVEDYDVGTVVQLTATPSEGWNFDQWVELDVNTNPLEVSITDSVTLTARFYVPIDSVSLTPSSLQMILGDIDTLKASIYPSNISDTINWKSSDESIAAVTQDGIVTAIAKGETLITAMTGKDSIANTAKVVVNTDGDKDGVIDENDTCADTPEGATVDDNGCAVSQKDTDGDGVNDDKDNCTDSPENATVDTNGCADSQKDTDGDGVKDDKDTCADSPEGAVIDTEGCPLPAIYLDANGVTIKASANAVIGESYELDGVSYKVVDLATLKAMISDNEDVTKVVTSFITQMNYLISYKLFNQDIGSWDVSNVTTMQGMFWDVAIFNHDIGNWDVSNVTNMQTLFGQAAAFNQDISSWDVSKVTTMENMFWSSGKFDQDLSSWNVANVTNMKQMFFNASLFNQDISSWDVSMVITMESMFFNAFLFNQDISSWDVSKVSIMKQMFYVSSAFNQDLSSWDVSSVLLCNTFSGSTPAWTEPKPNFTNCTE